MKKNVNNFSNKLAIYLIILMPLVAFFGLFLFGMSLYIAHNNIKYEQLEKKGISVISLPLQRYTKVSDDTSEYYEIKPEFIAQTGKKFKCTDRLSLDQLAKLEQSAKAGNQIGVTIYYQADDPNICQVKDSQWREQDFKSARRWSYMLIGISVIVFGLALTYRKKILNQANH